MKTLYLTRDHDYSLALYRLFKGKPCWSESKRRWLPHRGSVQLCEITTADWTLFSSYLEPGEGPLEVVGGEPGLQKQPKATKP